MFSSIVMFAVNALMAALTPEKVRGFIQAGVKAVQYKVSQTENKMDDALIPASNLVLAALDIPGPDGTVDISGELRKLFDLLKEHKDTFLDAGLDYVEDAFEQGSTADQIAEKAAGLVRVVLDVPDNDV
jgi:hypothetical protein